MGNDGLLYVQKVHLQHFYIFLGKKIKLFFLMETHYLLEARQVTNCFDAPPSLARISALTPHLCCTRHILPLSVLLLPVPFFRQYFLLRVHLFHATLDVVYGK